MIFESDPAQIKQLDSFTLVKFMKRLILSECRLVDIPLRGASVPLQITVADGGEDGRVEWTDAMDATDYFPSRFCIFQSKAQDLTASSLKFEILKKQKKGPPKLNAAISEVLSRHGSYIVFCSYPFGPKKIPQLRKAICDAIRDGGGTPEDATAIEIYDANRISDWVNTHRAVALWLTEQNRRRSLAGFQSHESWGRGADIRAIPWIDTNEARFVPVNLDVPTRERKEPYRNAWTFAQAAESVRKHLAEDKIALRIAGPSGFGKSRFAYELFNQQNTVAGEIENTVVIYADLTIAGDEIPKLALELADSGAPTMLVVDECPDELHRKLVDIAQRSGSGLRLVTIDVETKIGQATETLTVRLVPASDHTIGSIAKAVAPQLRDSEANFIQELAHGFPKMAVLAAQHNGRRRQAIHSVEQLLDRVVWGHKIRNDTAQKALECLSLFEWVGLTERTGSEASFIAQELAGMPEDDFIEHVKSFMPRGIIEQRGDFIQVTPVPLAAHLGRQRLALLPEARLETFFSHASSNLQISLLKRLRWLDMSPEAKKFAQYLLRSDNLGNIETLNTACGAECLDRLVHVDPETAMATIDRVFGGLTTTDLSAITEGRRHLIWALEKLVFRRQSFERAATLLRRLAAAETEEGISNNATGQFKQLYQLYLSGTEATPSARLLVLDDGLRSSNPKEREVCVEALGHMLEVNYLSRSGGAEEIGSGDHLKDWQPKTYDEIDNFLRAAITRLTDMALADDPLSSRAKQILGARIRTLINHLPFDEVKTMIDRIIAQFGFWPEAVQDVNAWLYYDSKGTLETLRNAVRSYFDMLMPTDPVELVVLYTQGWQIDFHDPDVDYGREDQEGNDHEYSLRKAAELAAIIADDPPAIERAIDRLAASDAKTIFPFTQRLAELVPAPVALFTSALTNVEARSEAANLQFFRGLIAGTDNRDPEKARTCIREALKSHKLKAEAISLIGAGRLQPQDIDFVISLLRTGDVLPWQCASLSYGRGLAHLSAEEIAPLLDELATHGAEGLWTALTSIAMVLHGNQQSPQPFFASIKTILVAPVLFDHVVQGSMAGYHLQETITLLIRHNAIDKKFARALIKQLFGICKRRDHNVFSTLYKQVRDALQSLIEKHPKEVWAEASRLLLQTDTMMRYRFKQLVRCEYRDHLGAGLFFHLPAELYLDWVRRDPAHRAFIVLQWLPLTTEAIDGSLSWHTALEGFIAEFGEAERVLGELATRFHPRSWVGSIVPHLEPIISLLEKWTSHPLPTVRHWASCQITGIKEWIEREKQTDEERSVRYA